MPVAIADSLKRGPISGTLLPDDDRWLLAKRIAESKTFAKSERLSQLLLYLCEQYLLGRATELSEQHIAYRVFERREGFDPSADTIVRSHMLRLRQKLDLYFEEEGVENRLRITIPKGGYLPVFGGVQENAATEVSAGLDETQKVSATAISRLRTTQQLLTGICILLGGLCVLLFIRSMNRHGIWSESRDSEQSVRHELWKQVFMPASTTILVAADSGLVMLHGATGQNSTLSEYLSRDFGKELDAIPAVRRESALSLANRRYTSFVDLEFFDRLTHLPESREHYSIRYARDINVNDLKSSNVILSGSQDANPWIELFEPQMNFVLGDDLPRGVRAFENRNPQPGERNLYICGQFEYGVLAFLPNLSNTGNALMIEGTSVAGTQAISDFLFTDSSLAPFLKKIARKDGSIPHFEILLESRSISGSASRSQILSFRLH